MIWPLRAVAPGQAGKEGDGTSPSDQLDIAWHRTCPGISSNDRDDGNECDEHEDHRTHQRPDLSQAHENAPVTRFGRMSGRLQGPVWSVLIVAHERRCLVEERLAAETAFRVVPGHFR